jgi:hypothetical protein
MTPTMQRHQVSDETKSSPPSFLIPYHLLPRTPIKRKKRASFTPRKTPSRHPRTSDPFPEPSPSVPRTYQEQDVPLSRRTKTDFLNDFTLWDNQKKRFRRPTQDEHEMIFDKIAEQFPNVLSIAVIFPWLIVEFEEDVPPTAERPFLIAGLVAIYLVEGEQYPVGISRIGTPGEGPAPTVPDSVASDLRPYHVPNKTSFEFLHCAVESAEHISSYPHQLLFELYPMSDAEFDAKVSSLPKRFGSLVAYYNNGEFVRTLASRQKSPNPQFGKSGCELVIDDTDYLLNANGGKIHPGVLLECKGIEVNDKVVGDDLANAGIAVSKDGEVRLTCASHMFDKVSEKIAYHGKTVVGEVEQTIGEDIGLIDLVVPVSNQFLEANCTATRLIRTTDIEENDIVSVDSCFTGPQSMLIAGTRYGKRRRRRPGPAHPWYYVQLEQGIFTSSDPIIPKPPVVRLGMCGTPLLRVANIKDDSVVAVGDILGFFLWVDSPSYEGKMLYSFAQPCDPLIDAGWEVANVD